jgi:hypothetical protein
MVIKAHNEVMIDGEISDEIKIPNLRMIVMIVLSIQLKRRCLW